MTIEKADIFAKIDLNPVGTEEFYSYILPEETNEGITYDVWVFRKRYGIASFSYGVPEYNSILMETLNAEYIKELDETGYFDYNKQELLYGFE